MENGFCALVVRENAGTFSANIEKHQLNELPQGDILIKVHYSSLNYKDALSASGNKGITKNYPHTPGIDAAGVIEESSDPNLQVGLKVIVTGYDLGMNTWGGLSQYIRVPSSWVVPLPEGLSLRQAMIYGTSGFTAAQALHHIINFNIPKGECLVTGASGAVGSMAIALLANQGHEVVAMTRDQGKFETLKLWGAKSMITASELLELGERPLLKSRWNAVVDTVGGRYLSTALRSTNYRGVVTCCGMIDSAELHVSIFPFILRGVKLMGLDSAECPLEMKKEIWKKLAGDWKPPCLDQMALEVPLTEVASYLASMIKGKSSGKIIVNLSI